MNKSEYGGPVPIFNNYSAIAVVIGVVVGIGIFRLPSIVAQNSISEIHYLSFWIAGGVISILGALCYAELATTKPDAGGEYFFLSEAFGSMIGFLFTWGRMTVIQTGSIALTAFILGDYATVIYDLGSNSSAIYAGLTIIILTSLNIIGTRPAKNVQNIMTSLIILVLLSAGILGIINGVKTESSISSVGNTGSAGVAMIFVLLTYGGWNEGVYLSAEIKDVKRNMVRVLLPALVIITFLYLLINGAYLQVLGLETLKESDTIGVDLSNQIIGSGGAFFMAVLIVIAALSTANATIMTGARTNYALGRDFPLLKWIGRWNKSYDSPINALLIQGGIAFSLVILGSFTQEAVETMVDYTAPVFWFFILLTTVSLFVFRAKSGNDDSGNHFKVPLYPLPPLLFIAACLYLLYSSIMLTGFGALIGIGILALGLPLFFADRFYSSG